jgi:uncharacterized membrane protein YeiB
MCAHGERGQTLPLWTLAIAATLTVLFFVTNYANVVRWNVRAQNAADSAAAAGIATDANMYNQVSTLEYAATIEETRMRYLIQAITNTVNYPASCGSSCDAYYVTLVNAYNSSSNGYTQITNAMKLADQANVGGLKNSPDKAVGLASTSCALFDCAFAYTGTYNAAAETVDVVACKKIPYLSPALFGLGSTATFTALGRSVATIAPISEAFGPGNVNPKTGTPFQPDESPTGTNADYVVSYKTVTANLTWYVPGTTRPTALAPGYACS